MCLPRPQDPHAEMRVLRDSVFVQIRDLLVQYGKGEWSLRPRTFAILRMLGCLDALDEFIKQKRTDSFLPYSDGNLPEVIKGDDPAKQVHPPATPGALQPKRHPGARGRGEAPALERFRRHLFRKEEGAERNRLPLRRHCRAGLQPPDRSESMPASLFIAAHRRKKIQGSAASSKTRWRP